jgi:NDP-sugar pyrophosphorylase family protein
LPVRALILAAGEGRRLRDVTDLPKPMVEVAGKPVLEHNIRLLVSHGITDIAVNLHYRPGAIVNHFADGSRFGARLEYYFEESLLGTAGALVPLREWLGSTFVVCYGDTYRDCDVTRLIAEHDKRLLTMAVIEQENVLQSGILEMHPMTDRIVRFLEKPQLGEVFSHWTNAGLMVCNEDVFSEIPNAPCDFSREVLPRLLRYGVYGYRMAAPEFVVPIDTPADYARAMAAYV